MTPDLWRDISSAPKDATAVLLFCPDGYDTPGYAHPPGLAKFIVVGWVGNTSHDYRGTPHAWCCPSVDVSIFHGSELTGSWNEYEWVLVKPSHWMPLAKPAEDSL